MAEMKTVYAVVSGEYSDYTVHAIYENRADAEARIAKDNEDDTRRRDESFLEEFDWHPGEPTPLSLEVEPSRST